MKHYVLGLDQGTSGVAAILFDEQWCPVARGYREIRQIFPRDGFVEHDACHVWEVVCEAVAEALDKADATPEQVLCVGLDHEGESVMLWDRLTGRPLGNVIVWQDRRTAAAAEELAARHGERIRRITGLPVDSYFSALKLRWLLDNTPDADALLAEGRLLAGNLDAWMAWNMTGGRLHATDASTASRTMLFDLKRGSWSEELLDLFGIPAAILPTIYDSACAFAETDPAAFCGIKAPLSGMLNDQQAALFGQSCFTERSVKTTYGTGCFMLMNTGEKPIVSDNGLLPTVAWRLQENTTFALDGGVYIAGAATRWLRDGLGIITNVAETEEMALRAGSNGGVYFVPAFTGLASPYWDSYARGMMIGITGATTRDHIVRATLEATAYQVAELFDLMQQTTDSVIPFMRCDGGAADNHFLMQFQADILRVPVEVPTVTETTAMGAAFMAALGAGLYRSPAELAAFDKVARRYEPTMSPDERDSLLHDWKRAVERCREWAK